jgi:DNA-binding transcriptional ArsR family regulator
MSFKSEEPAGEAGVEAGSVPSLEPVKISDPRALRALAHPARIAIMQRLILDGAATATECAEVAGLSPSACSYHLRALARYGFVEEEPAEAADQRHRPWRARMVAVSIGEDLDEHGQSDALRAAGRLLLESVHAWVEDLRASYFDHEAEYPREWQKAFRSSQVFLHVTAGELQQIGSRINEVLADYARLNPDERPPGARRVHVLTDFTPSFGPSEEDQGSSR